MFPVKQEISLFPVFR